MKYELRLSYIDYSLWWNRSLNVNSKEWKELRIKVLERDNYRCSFCDIKSSKYMIVDHINGDSTNNSLENLRINCPMCDTIRHSGLAGIKKTLIIRKSKLNQLEILKKTKCFYLKNKKCPLPENIDPFCEYTDLLPIEVATEEGKKILNKFKVYKGFFTNKFNFEFLKYLI